MKHYAWKWFFVAAYTGMLTWMSLSSVLPVMAPHWFKGEDKMVHAGAYGLYALLIGVALQAYVRLSAAGRAAFVWSSLYGVGMEFAQGAWSGGARTFSPGDMLANAVGAAAGVVTLHLMRRRG
jgi:hypothetical protein